MKTMQFKLLAGRHHERIARPGKRRAALKSYSAGDIIESPLELDKMFKGKFRAARAEGQSKKLQAAPGGRRRS